MLLCYIDESGTPETTGNTSHEENMKYKNIEKLNYYDYKTLKKTHINKSRKIIKKQNIISI